MRVSNRKVTVLITISYLDIYPLDLPCRYQDKIAQYDTVYIITNIPLEKQYVETQKYEYETWQAFRRRIDEVIEMTLLKFKKGVIFYV